MKQTNKQVIFLPFLSSVPLALSSFDRLFYLKSIFIPSIYLVCLEGDGLACTIHSMCVEIRGQLAEIRPWASKSSCQAQYLGILPSELSLQPCLASFELFKFALFVLKPFRSGVLFRCWFLLPLIFGDKLHLLQLLSIVLCG